MTKLAEAVAIMANTSNTTITLPSMNPIETACNVQSQCKGPPSEAMESAESDAPLGAGPGRSLHPSAHGLGGQ